MSVRSTERSSRLYSFCIETKRCRPVRTRDALRRDHLFRGEIRGPDVPDLPLADEIVERAQRFLDWRFRVGPMQLIEVDPIRLEPFEARLDSRHHIASRRSLEQPGVVHGPAELGRDHHARASRSENPAEKLLRSAAIAVVVGGIEQRDAGSDGLIDDGAALLVVATKRKIVAAEADCGHHEIRVADFALFHDCPILENP
jgi:hypothetical protein